MKQKSKNIWRDGGKHNDGLPGGKKRTSDCCSSLLSSLSMYTSFLANIPNSLDRSSFGSSFSLDPLLPSPLADSLA